MEMINRFAIFAAAGVLWTAPAIGEETGAAADAVAVNAVRIPGGLFTMGSDRVDKSEKAVEFGNRKPWYLDEHPAHTIAVSDFYIDKFEVTNQQYRDYIAARNLAPPQHWVESGYVLSLRLAQIDKLGDDILRRLVSEVFHLDVDSTAMDRAQLQAAVIERLNMLDKLPVTQVSWFEANDYCQWAGEKLPTEAQWEKAARGTHGNEFVWGNEWKVGLSNSGEESWDDGAAPVGSYPLDKSEYGVMDMAGNVSEWTGDWYDAYPKSDYKSEDFGQKFRVARGGAWGGGMGHYSLQVFQRTTYRINLPPDGRFEDVGFRCAADKEPATTHAMVGEHSQHN